MAKRTPKNSGPSVKRPCEAPARQYLFQFASVRGIL